MKKVYAVMRLEDSESSSYSLEAIFDTEEKAQAFVDKEIIERYDGEVGKPAWFKKDYLIPYLTIKEMSVQ